MSLSRVSVEDALNMSLDEYINANKSTKLKKYRKYRSQHSLNSDGDIEMSVDQFNGYGKSTSNALSQHFRWKYPNWSAKFYKRKYFNSNQRRHYRGANAYRINRNNQPNFKPQNLRSYSAAPSCVATGTNRIATCQPQTLASLTSEILSNPHDFMNLLPYLKEKLTEIPQKLDEQKYDMEIQKVISEIQGKNLYINSASDQRSVISLDGPGIDDCQFIVSTTSITLNQRFS